MMVNKSFFIILFLLTDDIFRGVKWAYEKIFPGKEAIDSSAIPAILNKGISRSDFLVRSGLVVAALPFEELIYGMVKGAYDYQVKNIK